MTLIQPPQPWPRTEEALFDVGAPVVPVPCPELPPEPPKVVEVDRTEAMEFSPPLAGATISPCGKYRYVLWRKFKTVGRRILWNCLNPSWADGSIDDPSLGRMMSFSKREGASEIYVCNFCAYRTSKPAELYRAAKSGFDVEGPENKRHIAEMLKTCDMCIVGWGNARALRGQSEKISKHSPESMMEFIKDQNVNKIPIMCLGTTKHGHPRHPLFVPASRKLVPFDYKTQDEGVDF